MKKFIECIVDFIHELQRRKTTEQITIMNNHLLAKIALHFKELGFPEIAVGRVFKGNINSTLKSRLWFWSVTC